MAKKKPAFNFDDYEIREDHSAILLTLLGKDSTNVREVLPPQIRQRYIECKQLADRINLPMTPMMLWQVVVTAGPIEMVEPTPPTVYELWKDKTIRTGHTVYCSFGGKHNLQCVLLNCGADRRPFLQMPDGEERKIPVDDCYLEKR